MRERQPVFTLLAGALASLLVSCGVVSGVLSVDIPESITLSPTSKHYQLKAGQTIRDELTVVNDGKTDYTFRVYADPYSVNDENYQPDFTSVHRNTLIPEWVAFEKDKHFIKAGETVKIPYSLSVPKNAAPGGHYGVLFAETQPAGDPVGNSIARKKRVGAIVYATIEGAYKVSGNVKEVIVGGLQFVAPLRATFRIENNGNTDFAATTKLLVTDVFGGKKYEASKQYQVLPVSTRKIIMDWSQAPSLGLFKVTATASILNKTEQKSTYVFMAPIWSYLMAGLGSLAAIIYFVQKRR